MEPGQAVMQIHTPDEIWQALELMNRLMLKSGVLFISKEDWEELQPVFEAVCRSSQCWPVAISNARIQDLGEEIKIFCETDASLDLIQYNHLSCFCQELKNQFSALGCRSVWEIFRAYEQWAKGLIESPGLLQVYTRPGAASSGKEALLMGTCLFWLYGFPAGLLRKRDAFAVQESDRWIYQIPKKLDNGQVASAFWQASYFSEPGPVANTVGKLFLDPMAAKRQKMRKLPIRLIPGSKTCCFGDMKAELPVMLLSLDQQDWNLPWVFRLAGGAYMHLAETEYCSLEGNTFRWNRELKTGEISPEMFLKTAAAESSVLSGILNRL